MSTSSRPSLGRAFWRIWATQTLSIIGSTLSGIGVAVHVYVETGDARWLGALTALAAAPYVLAAPLLGWLDRFSRRSMLILGDCLAAVGPLLALSLAVVGRLEVWHLVAAAFLTGVGNAVQTPTLNAVVPALLPEASAETFARANGLLQIGPAAGIVLGPALATPLVAWFGVESVLVVDAVTFAIAVGTSARTQFAEVGPTDEEGAGAAVPDDGSWSTAFAWLRREGRPLLVLLVAMGVVNFVLAFFNLATIAVATDVAGTAAAGVAMALGGLAMIAGSFATGVVGVARRPVRVFALSLAVMGVGCAVAAVRPWFPVVALGIMVAIAPVSILNAGVSTLFHTRVPSGMHGRVFAVRSTIGRSLDPIGAAVAGFVIADVAAPAMRPGGAGATVFGRVLGVGAERGAALVLLGVGVAIGVLGACLGVSRRLRELDGGGDVELDAVPAAQPLPAATPSMSAASAGGATS